MSISKLNLTDVLEYSGCASGLIGAALLASRSSISAYGWIFFLLANFAMLFFSFRISRFGLFAQQVGFTVTSVFGLVRALT